MSVLGNSQVSLPIKTVYNGDNAVIISEAHMDTISLKILRFNLLESRHDATLIELEQSRKENEKLMVSVDFLTNDNSRLKLINTTLIEQFDIKEKQHETEIELWKSKARGRLKSLLLGTGIGALVVALLTLL